MISIDGKKLKYISGGLFTASGDDGWIHPTRTGTSYEIIYILKGTVYLFEDDVKYELMPKDLIILKKGSIHGGYEISRSDTSFYWLHFETEDINSVAKPPFYTKSFPSSPIFRQILHYSYLKDCPKHTCDVFIAGLLCEIETHKKRAESSSNKLIHEITEWIRINASGNLTVYKIARHFSYNSEHISRLIKKEYKTGLKSMIDDFIIKKANDYLINTNFSVKEIAAILEFPDSSAFINFYKYHENTTPTKFRNSYANIHMNKN